MSLTAFEIGLFGWTSACFAALLDDYGGRWRIAPDDATTATGRTFVACGFWPVNAARRIGGGPTDSTSS